MSMVAEYRKCPRCKKICSWNPDAGELSCPSCGALLPADKAVSDILGTIFKKKK